MTSSNAGYSLALENFIKQKKIDKMKKIANQIPLILLSVFFFTACKKSDLPEAPQPIGEIATVKPQATVISRVKSRKIGTEITNFTYDGYGRQNQASSNENNSYIYQNGNSSIKATVYLNNGILYQQYLYLLNSKGLAEKKDGGGYYTNYTYNAKKNLVNELTVTGDGATTEVIYTYSQGNITEIKTFYGNIHSQTRTFTYYTDKINSLDNEAFGQSYLGLASKNLVKSMILTSAAGVVLNTQTYEYEFDGQGRVVKKKKFYNGSAWPDELYTY